MTTYASSAELGAYLRITDLDSTLATLALEAADEAIDSYLDQRLEAGTSTDARFDGNGTKYLALDHLPVNAVSSLTLYTADLSSSETLVSGTDFILDSDRGVLHRYDGGVFTAGRQNVKATFTYGYATIPATVRAVALQVAARVYDVGQVEAESLGGYSATYVKGGAALTADERLALYPWRRSS